MSDSQQPQTAGGTPRSNEPKKKKKAHPGGQVFACKQCKYTCAKGLHLKLHVSRKHEGLKPYQCRMCDFKTAHKSNIKMHIKIHFGATPFKCNACEYRCADKQTLKLHKNNDPHKCNMCPFECVLANDLIKHKREHKQTMLVKDTNMNANMNTNMNANMNMNSNLNVNVNMVFKCLLCDYKTFDNEEFQKHKKTHWDEIANLHS